MPIFQEDSEVNKAQFIADDLLLLNLPYDSQHNKQESDKIEEAPKSYWTVMDRTGRLVEMQNDLRKVLEKDDWTSVIQEATTDSTTMLMLLSESG